MQPNHRETERRLTQRHRMQFSVAWTLAGSVAPQRAGTLNVSVNGVLIWLDSAPTVGSRLEIRLQAAQQDEIVIRALVRWAGRHRGRAVVGLFIDVEETDPEMLAAYLNAVQARLRRKRAADSTQKKTATQKIAESSLALAAPSGSFS